jgi:hypothetical protein
MERGRREEGERKERGRREEGERKERGRREKGAKGGCGLNADAVHPSLSSFYLSPLPSCLPPFSSRKRKYDIKKRKEKKRRTRKGKWEIPF